MQQAIEQLASAGYPTIANTIESLIQQEQYAKALQLLANSGQAAADASLSLAQICRLALLDQVKTAGWEAYFEILSGLSSGYEVSACLKLLDAADAILNRESDIADSQVVERFLIGGISDQQTSKHYPFDTQLMGNMQGFASYKKLLRNDPQGLSKLLKILPSTGPIDGWHYTQFIQGYRDWFAANGFKQCQLFPATRLLSIKRPDYFVALDPEACTSLCQLMQIKPLKKQDFQGYWDHIVQPLRSTSWGQSYTPMDNLQQAFHRSRFALLQRLLQMPRAEADVELTAACVNPEPATVETVEGPNTKTATKTGQSQHFIQPERRPKPKKAVKQPKKMTITKRQSAKLNQTAATKLMSQYYFANKAQFGQIDMKAHRQAVIDKLVAGESVESAFNEILEAATTG